MTGGSVPLQLQLPRRTIRSVLIGALIRALLGAVCTFGIGCNEASRERDIAGRVPEEWATAAIDTRTGGRTLEDRQQALTRFQEDVLATHTAIPYPHYADPGTVVVAIKSAFIESAIRRRLRVLLEHEAESDLEIVAITDAPVDRVETTLGLHDLPAWKRVSLVQVAHPGPSPTTFPFIRDYAPMVRGRPAPGGFEVTGLVLFGGSNLNKVLDRELGVNLYRNIDRLRERRKVTSQLIEIYKERLRAKSRGTQEVLTHRLETALDGGNLISDGRGTCFLTEIVVDKNRGHAEAVRRDLKDKAGCVRTVFLEAPQRLDVVQHVDTLLYFADPQNAILSMPTLYASDRGRELRNAKILLELGYTVHLVPRKTASLTYANILTTRENVYVPQYTAYLVETDEQEKRREKIRALDRKRDRDELVRLLRLPPHTESVHADAEVEADNRRALAVVRALFPGKNVIGVNSDETLGSLGSWHCLTHELP